MVNTKLLTPYNIAVIVGVALIWQLMACKIKQHLSSSQAGE